MSVPPAGPTRGGMQRPSGTPMSFGRSLPLCGWKSRVGRGRDSRCARAERMPEALGIGQHVERRLVLGQR